MRFDVVTLFPELFTPFLSLGVTRRAYEAGLVSVHFWNPRDYATGLYRRVDDRPFGGGPGMVMMAEPLALCVEAIQAARRQAGEASHGQAGEAPHGQAGEALPGQDSHTACDPVEAQRADVPVILFSPVGEPLSHARVEHWAGGEGAILVCGRYEGVDQRFIDDVVTHQLSLGDFVLSGGEIAALALLDAVARLQPGVLHDAQSHALDSFNPQLGGLLDCPHYTRPETWRELAVPSVLLSGHHVQIERWREQQRLRLTAEHRPDLLSASTAVSLQPTKKP